MARIWNPTEEKVETKIFGSFFTFAPGAFKNMSSHHADFIKMNRKETGLVVLSSKFDPMDEENYVEGYDKSPEGKAELIEKKKEGIQNLLEHYEWIIYNNQVSLRNDLVKKDPHTDPIKLAAIHASKGELEAMRLVSKYQKLKLDDQGAKVKEVEKLMSEIGPIGK
jgi:tRNA U34 5-carboxymethylaminomethyl modifying GTPase MnmE/TrmE